MVLQVHVETDFPLASRASRIEQKWWGSASPEYLLNIHFSASQTQLLLSM